LRNRDIAKAIIANPRTAGFGASRPLPCLAWVQPFAHGAEAYEIHKHRGRHLALSYKPSVGLYSIGDKPLNHARRRKTGACALKLLKRGFGRC